MDAWDFYCKALPPPDGSGDVSIKTRLCYPFIVFIPWKIDFFWI